MKSNYEIATVTNLKKYCMDIRLEALNNRQAGRKKVYFAGPWFDKKAKLLLKTIKYICEVTTLSIYDIVFPDEYNFDLPSKTYKNNIDLITACDVVIANIASKDVGTAYEIGYAKALGKQIILLGCDETCFEKARRPFLLRCNYQIRPVNKIQLYQRYYQYTPFLLLTPHAALASLGIAKL